jgi:hypothetical protein
MSEQFQIIEQKVQEPESFAPEQLAAASESTDAKTVQRYPGDGWEPAYEVLFPNIVTSAATAEEPVEMTPEFEEPPIDIHWHHTPITLPKATKVIFEDAELYLCLCDFCRQLKNLEFTPTGRVTQTFCQGCRTIIGRHKSSQCSGGTRDCVGIRYVDEVGSIAPLCRGCHRHEEDLRRGRRGASRNSPTGRKIPLAAFISNAPTRGAVVVK